MKMEGGVHKEPVKILAEKDGLSGRFSMAMSEQHHDQQNRHGNQRKRTIIEDFARQVETFAAASF